MAEIVYLRPWQPRVLEGTLDLVEDEERRCFDLSILQCSVLHQLVFPYAYSPKSLVSDHGDYQKIVEKPEFYLNALEELEELLSGAYGGPERGCPVGEVFVDRGDLPGWDFTIATLTADNAWHDVDLTNVVGDTSATRVLLGVSMTAAQAGQFCQFREQGNSDAVNVLTGRVQVANMYSDLHGEVVLSENQNISYFVTADMDAIDICIRGYWVPAV